MPYERCALIRGDNNIVLCVTINAPESQTSTSLKRYLQDLYWLDLVINDVKNEIELLDHHKLDLCSEKMAIFIESIRKYEDYMISVILSLLLKTTFSATIMGLIFDADNNW